MRRKIDLNSWRFHLGDVSDGWYRGGDERGWEAVHVPHDWAITRGFSKDNSSGTGYVCGGIGWYRTRFNCKPERGQRVRITFEGVYNNSMVWCNSNYLGKRPFGYSTFTYDITEFLAADGDNEISVKVCHTETADSRWYTGSGIVRPVYVTVTGEPYIDDFGVFVSSRDVTAESAAVDVKVNVIGDGEITNTILDADGNAVVVFSGAEATVTLEKPELWEFGHPYLYTLRTEVKRDGEITDNVDTRFGIRDLRFDPDHGFFCNGKHTKLLGVCVHHDAGTLGAAVPPEVWRRRLLKLMECGCNAVRTSHNPPDPALLDLCDELGLYVMDEAFDEWEAPKNKWWQGHNVRPPKLNGYYEDFIEWGECDLKTMVLRDRNHPSVIMWSIGNEVDYPNDPYVYPEFDTMTGNNDAGKSEDERRFDVNRPDCRRLTKIAERLVKWVKEVDTTRPVTAALAYPEMSVRIGYMQALDIAGYNYKEQFYDEHHAEFPKAFLYGSENSHDARAWEHVRDKDYICGQFLWTGIDYLGEAHGWPIRSSSPGLLDLAGFENMRFYQRRIMWCNGSLEGYLHVFYPRGDMPRRNPNRPPRNPEAFCFTNAKKAELFANGRSLGIAETEHYTCRWDISSESPDAEYVAVIYGDDGEQLDVHVIKTGAPMKLTAKPWGAVLSGDTYEITDSVCQLEVYLYDADGKVVANALNTGFFGIPQGKTDPHRPDVKIAVLGGELLGIENGDGADLTSYGEDHRTVNNGRLIAYIRGIKGNTADIHLDVKDFPEFSTTVKVRFE